MSLNTPLELVNQVMCTNTYSFPTWFAVLQSHCQIRGYWDSINPDRPDAALVEEQTKVLDLPSWTLKQEEKRRAI